MNISRILRNSFGKNSIRFYSNTSTSPEYSVYELKIPHGHNQWIAGKLWSSNINDDSIVKPDPIICQHGWLDNASTFDPLIPMIIKPNMKIFAVDAQGHGLSSHTNTYYNIFAEAMLSVKRILKHFNWEKVTLLGHSMGSINSFTFAGIFPELVSNYIAIENIRPVQTKHFVTSVRSTIDALFELEEKLKRPPPYYTYDEILKRAYEGRNDSVSLESCKILLRRGAVQIDENKYTWTHDLKVRAMTGSGLFRGDDVEELAKRIQCPICFIKGEPGHDYIPRSQTLEFVEFFKRHNKNFQFHLAPGTHHLHLNNPEVVAPIINDFLSQPKED